MEHTARDRNAHFLLRTAASVDPLFRRFFLKSEELLLRYRLECSSSSLHFIVTKLLHEIQCSINKVKITEEHLKFFTATASIAQDLLRMACIAANERCGQCLCKVQWELVPGMVACRSVTLHAGVCSITCRSVPQLLAELFSLLLSSATGLMGSLRQMERLQMLHPVLHAALLRAVSSLGPLHLEWSSDPTLGSCSATPLQASAIMAASSHFPACMQQLQHCLHKHRRLPHHQRYRYSVFLRSIGVPLSQNIAFWESYYRAAAHEHSACGHNWARDGRRYMYSLRHIYGLEGRRVPAAPHSCDKLQSLSSQPRDCGGCPFAVAADLDISSSTQKPSTTLKIPSSPRSSMLDSVLISCGVRSHQVRKSIIEVARDGRASFACRLTLAALLDQREEDKCQGKNHYSSNTLSSADFDHGKKACRPQNDGTLDNVLQTVNHKAIIPSIPVLGHVSNVSKEKNIPNRCGSHNCSSRNPSSEAGRVSKTDMISKREALNPLLNDVRKSSDSTVVDSIPSVGNAVSTCSNSKRPCITKQESRKIRRIESRVQFGDMPVFNVGKSFTSSNDSVKSLLSPNDSVKSLPSPNDSVKSLLSSNDSVKSLLSSNDSVKSLLSPNDSVKSLSRPNNSVKLLPIPNNSVASILSSNSGGNVHKVMKSANNLTVYKRSQEIMGFKCHDYDDLLLTSNVRLGEKDKGSISSEEIDVISNKKKIEKLVKYVNSKFSGMSKVNLIAPGLNKTFDDFSNLPMRSPTTNRRDRLQQRIDAQTENCHHYFAFDNDCRKVISKDEISEYNERWSHQCQTSNRNINNCSDGACINPDNFVSDCSKNNRECNSRCSVTQSFSGLDVKRSSVLNKASQTSPMHDSALLDDGKRSTLERIRKLRCRTRRLREPVQKDFVVPWRLSSVSVHDPGQFNLPSANIGVQVQDSNAIDSTTVIESTQPSLYLNSKLKPTVNYNLNDGKCLRKTTTALNKSELKRTKVAKFDSSRLGAGTLVTPSRVPHPNKYTDAVYATTLCSFKPARNSDESHHHAVRSTYTEESAKILDQNSSKSVIEIYDSSLPPDKLNLKSSFRSCCGVETISTVGRNRMKFNPVAAVNDSGLIVPRQTLNNLPDVESLAVPVDEMDPFITAFLSSASAVSKDGRSFPKEVFKFTEFKNCDSELRVRSLLTTDATKVHQAIPPLLKADKTSTNNSQLCLESSGSSTQVNGRRSLPTLEARSCSDVNQNLNDFERKILHEDSRFVRTFDILNVTANFSFPYQYYLLSCKSIPTSGA
ncbi:uncharacterized protein LOC108683092 [Hyalella azteca]|uniref:Uncharacterized protein LOC108683092 n=1 Tax=Hyalella azteca TaxID=294128 RepID=A0A8B7PNT3_HYAAZ|nr:uncharacterized protein LOC108683092 [Hyalella azteca]